MLKLKQGVALVAVGSLAFIAGRMLPAGDSAVAAQPAKDKAPKHEQPGAEMAMPKPGPEHRVLDAFVGEFKGGGQMWMMPGSEPEKFTGTVTREWAMDGWFVIEHIKGDAQEGQPAYKGLGMMGYNQTDKRYESAWIDNMSSNIGSMNGEYDAAKKTFTFTGDMINPMTQKHTQQRTVIDISNPDTEVMTGYCNDESGQEYKCFEGTFTRVSK